MEILDDPRNTELIAWLPHGRAFVIYRKREFAADVLPKYFQKFAKYSSFTRKLNRWGFVRVTRGPETGAYYHPLFRRSEPRLVLQMTCHSALQNNAAGKRAERASVEGSSVSAATDPEGGMPPMMMYPPPLPAHSNPPHGHSNPSSFYSSSGYNNNHYSHAPSVYSSSAVGSMDHHPMHHHPSSYSAAAAGLGSSSYTGGGGYDPAAANVSAGGASHMPYHPMSSSSYGASHPYPPGAYPPAMYASSSYLADGYHHASSSYDYPSSRGDASASHGGLNLYATAAASSMEERCVNDEDPRAAFSARSKPEGSFVRPAAKGSGGAALYGPYAPSYGRRMEVGDERSYGPPRAYYAPPHEEGRYDRVDDDDE